MMEMPGVSMAPQPNPYGSPTELPKHIRWVLMITKSRHNWEWTNKIILILSSAIGSKPSKMEVMELSDLHHPNCKINRKLNSGDLSGIGDRRESESSDSIILSPEASKATEAVEFIAEHLKNEDSYIQVSS